MEQPCTSSINYTTVFLYIVYWGNNARNSKDKLMGKKLIQTYLIEHWKECVPRNPHIKRHTQLQEPSYICGWAKILNIKKKLFSI